MVILKPLLFAFSPFSFMDRLFKKDDTTFCVWQMHFFEFFIKFTDWNTISHSMWKKNCICREKVSIPPFFSPWKKKSPSLFKVSLSANGILRLKCNFTLLFARNQYEVPREVFWSEKNKTYMNGSLTKESLEESLRREKQFPIVGLNHMHLVRKPTCDWNLSKERSLKSEPEPVERKEQAHTHHTLFESPVRAIKRENRVCFGSYKRPPSCGATLSLWSSEWETKFSIPHRCSKKAIKKCAIFHQDR